MYLMPAGPFTFVGRFLTDPPSNDTLVPCFECPDFWRVPGSADVYVLSTIGRGWAVGHYRPIPDDSAPDTFAPIHGKNIPQPDQIYDYGSSVTVTRCI